MKVSILFNGQEVDFTSIPEVACVYQMTINGRHVAEGDREYIGQTSDLRTRVRGHHSKVRRRAHDCRRINEFVAFRKEVTLNFEILMESNDKKVRAEFEAKTYQRKIAENAKVVLNCRTASAHVEMICPETGRVLNEFPSITAAAKWGQEHGYPTHIGNIHGCLNGRLHKSAGFLWRYGAGSEGRKDKPFPTGKDHCTSIGIDVYDDKTREYVRSYDTLTECALDIGTSISDVSRVVRGEGKQTNGYFMVRKGESIEGKGSQPKMFVYNNKHELIRKIYRGDDRPLAVSFKWVEREGAVYYDGFIYALPSTPVEDLPKFKYEVTDKDGNVLLRAKSYKAIGELIGKSKSTAEKAVKRGHYNNEFFITRNY